MSFDKILAVAKTEFRAMVRSKAFLISIVLLPLLMLGSGFAQKQISARADTSPRKFAVIDTSGRYYDAVVAAADKRNAEVAAMAEKLPRSPFVPERVDVAAGRSLDEVRVQLSERVRKEELFAFIEIPDEPGLGEKFPLLLGSSGLRRAVDVAAEDARRLAARSPLQGGAPRRRASPRRCRAQGRHRRARAVDARRQWSRPSRREAGRSAHRL